MFVFYETGRDSLGFNLTKTLSFLIACPLRKLFFSKIQKKLDRFAVPMGLERMSMRPSIVQDFHLRNVTRRRKCTGRDQPHNCAMKNGACLIDDSDGFIRLSIQLAFPPPV